MRSYFPQLLRIGSYSSQVGITRTGNNKVLHSFDTNLEFTFHIFLGNCSCKEVTPRYSTHALASPPFNLSICFDVNVQSPMQSCRSLRPLSISANVSKVVQKRLIFGRQFHKSSPITVDFWQAVPQK